ncbi:hypothetical protein FRC07_009690, partial [Ceratobasidium sp. 392]
IPSPQERRVGIMRLKRPTAAREKDASDDEDATEPILDSRQRKKHKVVRKPTKPAKSTKTISVRPWVDVPEPKSTTGRPHDHLARELSVLCYDSEDPDQARQLRCVGSINGCPFSWAYPHDSKSFEDNFQTEYSEHGDAWLDEPDPDGPKVNAKLIEASSLVDLDAPEVEDCLSDEAPAGLKNRREALNGSNKKAAVQQDEALTEEDWDF